MNRDFGQWPQHSPWRRWLNEAGWLFVYLTLVLAIAVVGFRQCEPQDDPESRDSVALQSPLNGRQ